MQLPLYIINLIFNWFHFVVYHFNLMRIVLWEIFADEACLRTGRYQKEPRLYRQWDSSAFAILQQRTNFQLFSTECPEIFANYLGNSRTFYSLYVLGLEGVRKNRENIKKLTGVRSSNLALSPYCNNIVEISNYSLLQTEYCEIYANICIYHLSLHKLCILIITE